MGICFHKPMEFLAQLLVEHSNIKPLQLQAMPANMSNFCQNTHQIC